MAIKMKRGTTADWNLGPELVQFEKSPTAKVDSVYRAEGTELEMYVYTESANEWWVRSPSVGEGAATDGKIPGLPIYTNATGYDFNKNYRLIVDFDGPEDCTLELVGWAGDLVRPNYSQGPYVFEGQFAATGTPTGFVKWPAEKVGVADPVLVKIRYSFREIGVCEELEEGQLGLEYAEDGLVKLKAGMPGTSKWDELPYISATPPTFYGKCHTASSPSVKTATISGIDGNNISVGQHIFIHFESSNTSTNPYLSINNCNAHRIMRYGSTSAGTTLSTSWTAGAVVGMTYDGINWIMDYYYDTNTIPTNALLGQVYGVCETASETLAKTVSIAGYTLTTGGIVSIKFVNFLVNNSALNINSKGARPILYNGSRSLSPLKLGNGDVITLMYDGSSYHIIAVDRWGEVILTLSENVDLLFEQLETVDEALDAIIAIQKNLIGLITFTIGGVEYEAKEGMTWGEWVESEYNSEGYYISSASGNVFEPEADNGVGYEGIHANQNDAIIPGRAYTKDL